MHKYNFISNEMYDTLSVKPIELSYHEDDHNDGLAPYFREVLRMEFRTNDMDKLKNDVFPKMAIEYPEPTFRNLFNKELSRRTCLHFWNIAHTASHSVIAAQDTSSTAFGNLIHLGYKPEKAAAISDALRLVRNGLSMRDLKNMSLSLYKSVNEASGRMNLEKSYLYSTFLNIGKLLDSFEPLSFSNFNL